VALVVRAWTRPLFAYDSWAYHLPFAARLHGIGGGAEGFVLDPVSQSYFDGFPLLVDWLQGLLWKITGTPRAVALVEALSLVAFLVYARAALSIGFASLVFGVLAVPMVAIHATSGYVDLVVGCAIAAQAIAGARLLTPPIAGPPGSRAGPRRRVVDATVFVGSAVVAGNAKFMGLALALAVAGYVAIAAARRKGESRRRLLGLVLLAVLGAGAWATRNGVRFGNPVYPIAVRLPLADVELAGPEPVYEKAPGYLRELGVAARPLYFLLSVTEIDWWLRGVEPEYSIDSGSGNRARRFGPAKTGGFCGLYVVALIVGLGLLRRRRGDSVDGRRELDTQLVRLFVVLTLTIAVLPQSHDLRFWLAWPLLLVATVVRHWESADGERRRAVGAAVGVLVFVASVTLLPTQFDLRLLPELRLDAATIRRGLDPRLLTAIDGGEAFCLDASFAPLQFRVSRAFLGGRHVVEEVRRGEECRVLPRLDVDGSVAAGRARRGPSQQR